MLFSFEKNEYIRRPPFEYIRRQNSFFQNRLAHLHTNFELDRTSRFREKMTFFAKNQPI